MWLEVEVGPGLFVPPDDDSFSVDYAVEAINQAYPGCTGMYLGKDGHMLAFYGRKGSTRASLMQDVAVEVFRAVSQLPTWMGFTARWKVRCVSLAEANDFLAGCKRLEKEDRRQEHLYFKDSSPQCISPPISQPRLFPFSHGRHCQHLGGLMHPEATKNPRVTGLQLIFLHYREL